MKQEENLQIKIIQWLDMQYPNCLYCSTLGGMRLTIGQAVKIKRMGYRKGIPDLILYEPRGQYKALFLELKSKKGKMSEYQKKWQTELNERGYKSVCCNDFYECVKLIKNYLKE